MTSLNGSRAATCRTRRTSRGRAAKSFTCTWASSERQRCCRRPARRWTRIATFKNGKPASPVHGIKCTTPSAPTTTSSPAPTIPRRHCLSALTSTSPPASRSWPRSAGTQAAIPAWIGAKMSRAVSTKSGSSRTATPSGSARRLRSGTGTMRAKFGSTPMRAVEAGIRRKWKAPTWT